MSRNTQSNSGVDENTVFSSTVHKLIFSIITISIGLLQVVVTNQSSASTTAADRHVTILCFCIFFLLYAILFIFEVNLRNKPPICQLVGHMSHLFGGLAALMIISNVSTIFTLIAAPLLVICFFLVIYISFAKLLVSVSVSDEDDDTRSTTNFSPDQLSPV